MDDGSEWEKVVLMCGYLPGDLPQRSPLLSPTVVSPVGGYRWRDVFGGGCGFAMAISEDAKVFGWGWNKYGQLGLGDVVDRNIPAQVMIDGCVPKNVACGWWHTLLLGELPT